MKKFLSLLIVAVMMLSIVASCGGKSKKSTTSNSGDSVISSVDNSQSSQSSQGGGTGDSSSDTSSDASIDDSATQEMMQGTKRTSSGFNYEDYSTLTSEYNRNLFYYNELKFEVADPTVIYVSKEQDPVNGGYFYAYGTSDQIRCNGIQGWRSKDLTNWEDLGPVFKPEFDQPYWSYSNYWAPDIIYDPDGMEIQGKMYHYFMFYTAEEYATAVFKSEAEGGHMGDLYMGVLYAESAVGPFISPDGFANQDGVTLSHTEPTHNFREYGKVGCRTVDCLDSSPFIDSDGQKYLYYSGSGGLDGQNGAQCIYGCKMKDWFTPDYESLTMICEYGKKTVGGAGISEGGYVNEGPFMVKDGDDYMLSFSVFGWTNPNYQIRLATSKSPLSGFTKLDPNNGGTVAKTNGTDWDIVTAGHHCFIKVGDQLFIAYHTFKNRSSSDAGRALAVDEVFIKEYNGQKIFVTNGPTHSYQPLPTALSGYKNIASEATIKGVKTNAAALTDKLIKIHDNGYPVSEATFAANATMTIEFSTYKNVRAIMVYLPYDYEERFTKIEKATITYQATSGSKTVVINDILYDIDKFYDTDFEEPLNRGGSAIIEFNDMPVKKIELKFSSPSSKSTLSIDEVVILSSVENTEIVPVSDINKDYKYVNALVPVAVRHDQGDVIGSVNVNGTPFYTNYGYDLSLDNGVDNIISNSWSSDQYAYFKGVSSTNVYFEAEFQVTCEKPYFDDQWPKLGLVARNSQACAFFYIDAASAGWLNPVYTKKQIGYTQSQIGGGTWDWSNTESLQEVPTIKYWNRADLDNDGWTKLAIIRLGSQFYFYCNDTLYFMNDQMRGLYSTDNAAYGFLCFNTGMQVRNYYCNTNLDYINSKLAELGDTIGGGNVQEATSAFGNNAKVTSAATWDLTQDYLTNADNYAERKVTLSSSDGVGNYLYFKNANSSTIYAEATFKTTGVFNIEDLWGKFGFSFSTTSSSTGNLLDLLYYVDANGSGGAITGNAVEYGSSSNGVFTYSKERKENVFNSANPIKLGIYRQNQIVKMLVNDEVVFTAATELAGAIYPAIFSFNIGLEVTDYRVTTNRADTMISKLYVPDTDSEGMITNVLYGANGSFVPVGYADSDIGRVSNSAANEARTYVQNIGGSKLYFETDITLNSVLGGDEFPKAGITISSATKELFFAIDANTRVQGGFGGCAAVIYNTRPVNGAWDAWPASIQAYGIKYTNGESTKLAVYYDNGLFMLCANGNIMVKLENIGITGDVVVGIMSFNLNVTATNARATANSDAMQRVYNSFGYSDADTGITIDADLSDWTGSYANKYSYWDANGLGYEVMATMTEKGVYVGYHGIVEHVVSNQGQWWDNTNVEMWAYTYGGDKIQCFAAFNNQAQGSNVFAKSAKTRVDGRYDVYFELYIPYANIGYTAEAQHVVMFFAFRPGTYNGVEQVSSDGWNWWSGTYNAQTQSYEAGMTAYRITRDGIVFGS